MNQRKIINKYKQDTKKRSVRDHKNLKSALKLLAENIYSSDDHFVYELIQNAQDNKYSDGIIPTLEFILLSDDPTNSPESEGCLCIYNNERGFTEEDIHGICSIGQSTKTDKKTSGSIGEKGIGFKSVFKISSYPHIFSNGFSIRLNDESYIDPDWVEELPKEVKVETSNTCILLPLKKGMYDYVCESLLNYESNTSIFLDKLKKIEISIPSIKHSSSVELKHKKDFTFTVCTESNSKETNIDYWIATKELNKPKYIGEESRKNITSTSIKIAFPLNQTVLRHK